MAQARRLVTAALHIVNGDEAVPTLARVLGADAAILPWRDVLHDGPVPAGLDLAALSAVRATYLAGCGHATLAAALAQFRARDDAVAALAADAAVTIWLEHDLCDQLQLLQLLHLAAIGALPRRGLRLAQADDYLGRMDAPAMAALGARARPVDPAAIALAGRAWAAFTAPTPEGLAALLAADLARLPFLRDALARLLEELPAPLDGLSRTERAILRGLAGGAASASELFGRFGAGEDPLWLGDLPFFHRIDALARLSPPLVAGIGPGGAGAAPRARLRLTAEGAETLRASRDRAATPPARWLGGTFLGAAPCWRWDATERRLSRA